MTLQHSSCLPDLNSLRRGPVFTRETVSEKYRGSPEPLTLLKLKVEPQIRFDSVFFLIIQRCRGLSSPPKDHRHRILQIHLEINSDWLTQLMLRMNSMALNRVIDVLHSILNPSNYVVRGGSSFRYREQNTERVEMPPSCSRFPTKRGVDNSAAAAITVVTSD